MESVFFFGILLGPLNPLIKTIKRKPVHKWASAILCVALACMTAQAHARYDPSWEWRTIRHDHFTIYYPAGHEPFAGRVLSLCDEVYGEVTDYLGIAPRNCPIVLNPGTDDFNGYYAPFPNRISLYETPLANPDALGPVSDPLKAVFAHEFTHFVHITARMGWYGRLCRVMGDGLAISNALSPGWMIEGVTTTTETLFTDGGRGRSSLFQGRMLSFAEEDRLWSLSAAGVTSPYQPPGDRIYLGGYFMMDYLRRMYGADAPARLIQYQALHPIGGTRSAIRQLTGKFPETVYREFSEDLEQQTKEHQKGVATNLPSGQVVWQSDSDSMAAHSWTEEGRILALRRGYDHRNALLVIDPLTDGIIDEILTGRIVSDKDVRILNDGRLLLCESFYHPLGRGSLDVADLVVYDPAAGKRERRTKDMHVFSADMGPDGRSIAATHRNGMGVDLVILDADGSTRVLLSNPDVHVDDPCWSPDGSHLAAAVKTGRNADIVIVDPVEGSLQPIFKQDSHAEKNPVFSHDGKWLIFASDRSGVWNIYAWDLVAKRLYQQTSVMYGASKPNLSRDDKTLSFLSIQRGLNRLCIVPFDPTAGKEIPVEAADAFVLPDTNRTNPETVKNEAGGIPAWEAYKPFIHMPFFGADEDGGMAGVLLMGGDPVGLNAYQLSMLYGTESRRPGYDLLLTKRSFWPDLKLRVYDNAMEGNTIGNVEEIWFRERGGELVANMEILHRAVPDSLKTSVNTGVRFRHFKGLDEYALPLSINQSMAVFAEVDMARLPDYPTRDLVPGWGQSLHVSREEALSFSPGEIPGHDTLLIARQFMPSPLTHHGFEWRAVHQRQSGLIYYDKDFSIPRGYDDADVGGGFHLRRTLMFSGEYHFPLWYADRGIGLMLCHLHLLRGSLFVDHGAGWDGDLPWDEWKAMARTSTGCTVKAETQVMAWLPLDMGFTVGYNPREKESFVHFLVALRL